MSTTNATHKCSERIWPAGGFHSVGCSKPGKVEHDGHWYCGTHSPEAKAKRRAASDARYAARAADMDKRHAAIADVQRNSAEHATMAARIAELERTLAAVTAQRDQCAEAIAQLVSQLEPVAVDAHEIAAIEDGRAALRACDEKRSEASIAAEGGAK